MNHLDLCSGIGGFAIAAQAMGWKTIAFCEKSEFCQAVLHKHFKGTPIYDDIFNLSALDITEAFEANFSTENLEFIDMASQSKDYDQALHWYEQGFSIQNIAALYGVTRQAMWAILKRRGCVFRDNRRYGQENHFHRGTKADDRAQGITERAIESGLLKRPGVCETCKQPNVFKDGRSGIQAHHCDYNKPLEVMWLCQKCHHKWHKENQAIPFKEASGAKEVNRLYSVDLLTGGFP